MTELKELKEALRSIVNSTAINQEQALNEDNHDDMLMPLFVGHWKKARALLARLDAEQAQPKASRVWNEEKGLYTRPTATPQGELVERLQEAAQHELTLARTQDDLGHCSTRDHHLNLSDTLNAAISALSASQNHIVQPPELVGFWNGIDLLPCPFCKSDNLDEIDVLDGIDGKDGVSVLCLDCNAHGPTEEIETVARATWNYRAALSAGGFEEWWDKLNKEEIMFSNIGWDELDAGSQKHAKKISEVSFNAARAAYAARGQ